MQQHTSKIFTGVKERDKNMFYVIIIILNLRCDYFPTTVQISINGCLGPKIEATDKKEKEGIFELMEIFCLILVVLISVYTFIKALRIHIHECVCVNLYLKEIH